MKGCCLKMEYGDSFGNDEGFKRREATGFLPKVAKDEDFGCVFHPIPEKDKKHSKSKFFFFWGGVWLKFSTFFFNYISCPRLVQGALFCFF